MSRSPHVRTRYVGRHLSALTAGLVILGLIPSAAVLSLSGAGGLAGWLGLIGLLPLFTAIRFFSPTHAALAGGFWGACVWLFIQPALDVGAMATIPALVWIVLASGGFAGLASYLHHRLRLGPLHPALAYLLFEVSLMPLGLGLGLLAATQQGTSFLGVFGRLFGYLLVAFLIAYCNILVLAVALLLKAVSFFRCEVPTDKKFRPVTIIRCCCSTIVCCLSVLPRPPPAQVPISSC